MKAVEKVMEVPGLEKKETVTGQHKKLPARLLSIDVFRAVTMFFMIFVNDVDGVKNIPEWIKHAGANDDGLGFADTIFPAFLFIVGLSLPFALKRRINNGDSFYSVAAYILTRSIALLVIGFLHVNLENYNRIAILPKAVWEIFITIGFFLTWLDYPGEIKKTKRTFLQLTGILLLVIMAYLYRGGEPAAPVGLRPYWWGILGIIGWAYLVCAIIFFLSKGKLWVQSVFFIIFLLINVAVHTGLLKFSFPVIGDASSASLTMAGMMVSLLYTGLTGKRKEKLVWMLLAIAGVVMLMFGLVIRPYAQGISKIHSTTAWISICIGISILVFELIIYLVDIKGKQHWFKGIRPAGTSTLTCYLIPYLLYSIYTLIGFHYPDFFNRGFGGISRSFLIAFFVIWIAGLLEKRRIRLRI
jgi:heparan-alpha-glucosaminide N-acetyltransferase